MSTLNMDTLNMGTKLNLRKLNATSADFTTTLDQLLAWEGVSSPKIQQLVDEIIAAVRQKGDAAVLAYTQQFDQHPATCFSQLEVSQQALKDAFESLPTKRREALEAAAKRVTSYHEIGRASCRERV